MSDFFTVFIFFFIYSVCGWILESIYCSILDKKWTNRGFLSGPYCPIYGFGSLIIISVLNNFYDRPLVVFLLGMVFTSALEYASSVLLEKMFNAKWWDYSKRKFNLNGRICLLNSLEFGILGILLTYFVHPFISTVILMIPVEYQQIISLVLITIMGIDTGATVSALLNFKEHLDALKEYNEMLKEKAIDRISNLKVSKELDEIRAKLILRGNHRVERMLNAFPDFEFKDLKIQFNTFKNELKNAREEIEKKRIEAREKAAQEKIQRKQERANRKANKKNQKN